MPKLPDAADLGPVPTPDAARPVGSYNAAPIAEIGQALGAGAERLGGGLERFGQGSGELAADAKMAENRWDLAKANATLQVGLVDRNAATAQDTNYGPDEDGHTLPDRHAAALTDLQNTAAAQIRDPSMAERFVTQSAPLLEESNVRAAAHARALENNANVAYVDQQGNAIIDKAVAAPDDASRAALIDSHNQLVDGLVAKGAMTPTEAVAAKQNWAHQYAAADALARADTDPQGVINELRAAPGSDDAMVNRILAAEGTGRAVGSSAQGAGRFTDATWLDEIKRNRPDLAQGASDNDILALRADPSLGRNMTAAYLKENRSFLAGKGLPTDPGSLYLAHFLGPGGAAAVLSASPNASVKQALTASLGADKADAMIAANPSILAGKQVSSVTGWAAGKMGGVTPGGGSIYDMLRPDMREEVLAHAEAALQKQQVNDRADFQMRVANATAEAYDTGAPSQPLTRADFIGQYGADKGPVEFAKYDTDVQTGRVIAGMATMTPDQRAATVDSLKPAPGDANYALKAHAYDVAQIAQARVEKQAADDPAGFAAVKLPASSDAYKNLSATLGNIQASPDDRAQAAQSYAAKTLMEQDHFGIPAYAQTVVPASYADAFGKRIAGAAASDDPQKRIGLIGQIQSEAAMWGQYWPSVMRQLAPGAQATTRSPIASLPIVRAIAAGADPTAMTRLLSLDPKEKPADVLKEQDTVKAAELNKSTYDAMAPFRSTMVGRQLDSDYPGYYGLASQLGALYVRDGMSADDAAKKAFGDLVGDRYDFRDNWRMPKSTAISADDVQAGTAAAREQFQTAARTGEDAFGAVPFRDVIGLGDQNRADSLARFGRDGKFVTAPGNDGLNLVAGDGENFVRDAKGILLKLTWGQLAKLGKDRRAADIDAANEAPGL